MVPSKYLEFTGSAQSADQQKRRVGVVMAYIFDVVIKNLIEMGL
jgi:hypothetical protein